MAKLSVIVPAHNEEKNIGKCLESICNQSFEDYECIVIADACTDRTAEIARSYGVKVIEADLHSECLGRNMGIENTSGEWVLFMDADDWYLHEFVFEQLMDRTEGNNADIIAYDIVWKHIGVVGPISGRDGQYFPHCTNKMWRRSFIGDTRFLNVKPDGDATFHKLIMQKNPKIDIFPIPVYYYNFLREGSYSDVLGRTAEAAIRWWRIK